MIKRLQKFIKMIWVIKVGKKKLLIFKLFKKNSLVNIIKILCLITLKLRKYIYYWPKNNISKRFNIIFKFILKTMINIRYQKC